jgi:hypothetical protein
MKFTMKCIKLPALLCLCPLCLCACKSVTFDVRRLEQPVLLSNNPCLAGKGGASPEVVNVDTYSATVSKAEMTASAGNTTTTAVSVSNQAQVNAFQKIGGQRNRVIRDLSLDLDSLAINGLFVLVEKASVQASGNVAEVRVRPDANTPATEEVKP